jgi:hypothetical protein
LYNFVRKTRGKIMSRKTLEYIKEMKDMYFAIMHKYVDTGELTEIDILFLNAYKRTIDKDIEIPS